MSNLINLEVKKNSQTSQFQVTIPSAYKRDKPDEICRFDNSTYVYEVRFKNPSKGSKDNSVSLTPHQMNELDLSAGDKVSIKYLNKNYSRDATEIKFICTKIYSHSGAIPTYINVSNVLNRLYENGNFFYTTVGQSYMFYYEEYDEAKDVEYDIDYVLTIESINGNSAISDNTYKLTKDNTKISIVNNPNLQNVPRFGNSSAVNNEDFRPNFKKLYESIGGLNHEIENIFDNILSTRLIPIELRKKLGIRNSKGIILHGEPGTGKTLFARELSKCMGINEKYIQIVNGPELLSSHVGSSEKNVRELFLAAREDQKNLGDESPLHMIIFDEFDSLCRKRGNDEGVRNIVNDNVVNQLLACIDGIDRLDNIIIVGMTNRIEMIDSGILRSGRFDVHIEFKLPEENDRIDIFKIHTRQLFENDFIDEDVNIRQLSKITSGFSGADIEGVVKMAVSLAKKKFIYLNEHVETGYVVDSAIVDDFVVTMKDFVTSINIMSNKISSQKKKNND